MENNAPAPNPRIVLWILWFAITSGLVMIYTMIPANGPGSKQLQFLPILPLAISGFIRWVLLPKATTIAGAMPIFIIGLAMAEGCGLLGIFLTPQLKQTYLVLALMGLMQFAPFWASRLK